MSIEGIYAENVFNYFNGPNSNASAFDSCSNYHSFISDDISQGGAITAACTKKLLQWLRDNNDVKHNLQYHFIRHRWLRITINKCHVSLPVFIITSWFSNSYLLRNWCTWPWKNISDGLNSRDKKLFIGIIMDIYVPEDTTNKS